MPRDIEADGEAMPRAGGERLQRLPDAWCPRRCAQRQQECPAARTLLGRVNPAEKGCRRTYPAQSGTLWLHPITHWLMSPRRFPQEGSGWDKKLGLITPPVGMNLFIIRAQVPELSMQGTLPRHRSLSAGAGRADRVDVRVSALGAVASRIALPMKKCRTSRLGPRRTGTTKTTCTHRCVDLQNLCPPVRASQDMPNRLIALPHMILARSASLIRTRRIQSAPGWLGTKGQSTANMILSAPISMIEH